MPVASVNGKPRARLEHRSPGRIRVRVPKGERAPAELQSIQDQLAGHPDVREVQVNSGTGSILVTGTSSSRLQSALADVLTLLEGGAEEHVAEVGIESGVQLVRSADEKLRSLTSGRFSLRALVPTVFVSLGIRELFRQGLSIGTIPWYVLIYYGVDSFLKLYPNYAPRRHEEVIVK